MLCLQFLFIANMIKVVLYEGVIKVRAFGDLGDVEATYCLQICFCNGWTPDEEVPETYVKRGNHHVVADDSKNQDVTAAEMVNMSNEKFGAHTTSAFNSPQKFNRR